MDLKNLFLYLAVFLLVATAFTRAGDDDKVKGWEKNKKPTKKGKHVTELDLTIKQKDGTSKSIKMQKRKALTPAVKTYQMQNGNLVEDDATVSDVQYSIFTDNTSSSILLMACDDLGCNTTAAIYDGTEMYTMEPADAEPYLNKGKSVNENNKKAMHDERSIGIGSDGAPLPVPFTTRKRRDLTLDRHMKESMLKRKRRQVNVNNVVELAVIIDSSEYQYWLDRANNDVLGAKMAIKLYVIMLTNMMDMRFDDLFVQTGDMDINFMVNSIIYAETGADSPWSSGNVVNTNGAEYLDVNKALDDLTVWGWQNRAVLPSHDHIIGITKRNLASQSEGQWVPDVIGVAWTGGMCVPGYSVSLVEDPGIGLIDYAAAHELGHNLGAAHDGASGCSDDDFFIMGEYGGSPAIGLSVLGNQDHPFQFSPCSITAIHDYVLGLGSGNCMKSSTFNQSDYDSYKDFFSPGTFLPIDTQCELQYGSGSRRCYALDATVCSDGAWCWNPADPGYCYTLYVRDGSRCGENMRCQKGVCVNSTIVVPTCPPPTGLPAQGGQVVVVPIDVTAIPDQLITTVTPYQSTAQTLYQTTLAQQELQTLPDSSEELFC